MLIKTAKKALSILGCDHSFSVNLVGETSIKKLNRVYRRKNRTTDILSFNSPAEIKKVSGYAGDIFICANLAEKNAMLYGHTRDAELAMLLVHGILHLEGYEHEGRISKNKVERMFKMQKRILSEVLGLGKRKRNKK
ncbi:MAG: rRNA maturation RNase YbeY [Pseudomonadota bacterium]